MPKTPSKLSHDCICGWLWTNATPILRIAFSYPNDQNQNHWAIWYAYSFQYLLHFQFLISQNHIMNFFNCFECSDLNWVPEHSESLMIVGLQQISVKHFFYHWNWWCRVPILFFKLTLGLCDCFFLQKINTWWEHEIHFFPFSPQFIRSSPINGWQTQTKWFNLFKIW